MTPRQRHLGLLALVCAVGLALLETAHGPRSPSDELRGMLVVEIGEDGALTLEQDEQVVALGRLGASDTSGAADAIEALRGELRARTRRPALRDERGHSTLVLRIVTGPTVPWAFVHWIVRVASDPNVELVDVRFALRGDTAPDIRWERPTGVSCCPGPYVQTTSPFVRMILGKGSDGDADPASGSMRVIFGNQTTSSEGQGVEEIEAETVTERATLASLLEFDRWWDGHREAMEGAGAELQVAGTSRRPVPCGEVIVVWRTILRAEVRKLHYWASFEPPAPRPR